MLAAADLVAALLATALVVRSSPSGAWSLLLLPPLWIVVAKLLGLYDRDGRAIRHLTVDELGSLSAWTAIGIAMVGLLHPFNASPRISLPDAVAAWAVATVAAGFLRSVARWLWRRTTPRELTAVIGGGELARDARRKLQLFADMHLEVVDGPPPVETASAENGEAVKALVELVAGLDRVIVASEHLDPVLIGRLAGVCRHEQVKLTVVSPLRGRAGAVPRLSSVADLPILEYDTRDVPRSTVFLKRAFDLLFASASLVVLAPLFPFAALAIRLETRGPVVFRQRRAGRGGKPFTILKMRTMVDRAEEALSEIVEIETLEEPAFKIRRDPRVTRVGRVLRRFSLDELPQLVNVVRGEMSIVGPRPEQVELVDRYRPEHRFRLDVTPGMTGPMQVLGRGELTFSERLAVELDYVENLSLARDFGILLQTVPAVLRGTGAY